MKKIDHQQAIQRALALRLHSALDAAFLAVSEQLCGCDSVTLDAAVKVIDNDQVLDYAAFLYQSQTRQSLSGSCAEHPVSVESEREWELTESEACLARSIAQVAAEVDAQSHPRT